jgi:hypothetical protein
MKDDNKILNRVFCVALFCYACFMIYLMTKVMIKSQKLIEQNIRDPKKKTTHKIFQQVCCTNQKIHNMILGIMCLNYAIVFMSIMFLVMDATGMCYFPQKVSEKKFVGFDNQMIILFVISLANMIMFWFLNSYYKNENSKYCDDSGGSNKQFVKKCLISYSISTLILLILGIVYRYFTHEDRMSEKEKSEYRAKKEREEKEREEKKDEKKKREEEMNKLIENDPDVLEAKRIREDAEAERKKQIEEAEKERKEAEDARLLEIERLRRERAELSKAQKQANPPPPSIRERAGQYWADDKKRVQEREAQKARNEVERLRKVLKGAPKAPDNPLPQLQVPSKPQVFNRPIPKHPSDDSEGEESQ